MSKRKSKIKNTVLKTITWIAGIVWLISACMVDSESWIPTICVVVCGAWLCMFVYVNCAEGDFYD